MAATALETEVADLKAQIVAQRIALEGAWLSLLHASPTAVADAERLGNEHVAAVMQLQAETKPLQQIREAVAFYTQQIWGSIGWQLANPQGPRVEPGAAPDAVV